MENRLCLAPAFPSRVVLGRSLINGQTLVVENPQVLARDSYRTIVATPYQPMNRVYSFEPETLQALAKANQRLARDGKAPVAITRVTQEIEDIAHDSSLTDKNKRRMINDIRKRLGLKKGEMKTLFTKRLEKIYGEMIQVARIQGVTGPKLEELEKTKSLYKSMYKPGGCIKKLFKGIGSFFKGVGQFVAGVALTALSFARQVFDPRNWFKLSFWRDIVGPMALNFVPAIGPVAATLYRWGQGVSRGVQLLKAGPRAWWHYSGS